MSFSIRNNFCHKCGKPLSIFEQGLCIECETAEQNKCEHNCEECEHNDGECCRILFERSFEQLRTEVERATVEMDYETAQEALAVIDRYAKQKKDDYDKVLAYLKANVDDFPDYHEAIEAVLKMKGGKK